jgi:hypothetical protein
MTKKSETKPADTEAKAPAKDADRLDALEKEVAELRELMKRNGWSC